MPIQTATIVEVKGPRRRKIVPGKRPIEVHRLLTVGEVSARSGVAVSALHFYEAKGLIASRRSEGNQRRYHREVLRRVAVIKVAQRVGIPLAEIGRAPSALPEGSTPTAADRAALSRRRHDDLAARTSRLPRLGAPFEGKT